MIVNETSKLVVDLHKRVQKLLIGDEVIVIVHPERFPLECVKELYARRTGPYKVLRRISDMPMSWMFR